MKAQRQPAPFLPVWARDFYNDWREPSRSGQVSIDDETPPDLPHRRTAFYALLGSDRVDMRVFWEHAESIIRRECERRGFPVDRELRWFLSRLILATDEKLEPERYRFDRSPQPMLSRLRDPLQALARKTACQIRELALITPGRLISGTPCDHTNPGDLVDALVSHYRLTMPAIDYYWLFRRHQIEFNMSSKRGWVQHAQAAEKLRPKLAANLRNLATRTQQPPHFMRKVWRYAEMLDAAPSLEVLSLGEPALASQKTSWMDWLRTLQAWYVVDGELEIIDALPKTDWATLVSVLFDENVTERNIRLVLSRESAAAVFSENAPR